MTATHDASPTHTQPVKHKSKKNRILALAAVAVLIAVIFTAYWWLHGRNIETTDDAYIGGDITAISAKVDGYITEVAVQDNQAVHKGNILVRLDNRSYQAQLDKAQASVQAQQAALHHLDSTRYLQQAVIIEASAKISATQAETQRTQNDLSRYQTLSATHAVSVQSLQQANADYKQAVAATRQAEAALMAEQRQLQVIDSQKLQIQAALAQAVAERDMAKLNLDYTLIVAPIDGVVGNRRSRTGAYASAGSQLLSLVPTTGLWVDANFKEDQLATMLPGQPAKVHADVLPGHTFQGTVVSLAPATGSQFSVLPAENATGNFTKIVQRVPVRIMLDPDDAQTRRLRPGLSVVAAVDLNQQISR